MASADAALLQRFITTWEAAMSKPSARCSQTMRMDATTHLRRLTTLAELANTAAFMASDHASAMTGTVVNLSGGTIAD